jgi:spermidine synthase/MFS family permease
MIVCGMESPMRNQVRYSLEAIAFISGASIMAIEIVASRIMSPYFGNSIVVWTSLIGVILAALSYGYWKGGRLADKTPTFKTLSAILASGAALTALIAITKNPCLNAAIRVSDIRLAAIAAEVVLFAPVSLVLAMVAPYVVRLKMTEVGSSGETVGRLYAISTIGSIVGTFGAGFILLALIGSTAILFSIAVLLLGASALASRAGFRLARGAAAAVVVLCALAAPSASTAIVSGKFLYETDTHYNHAMVYEATDPRTGRPVHNLYIDRYFRLSSVFVDKDDDLVLEYLKYFRLARHFRPDARRHLLLGGGAFTYAKDFFRRNPDGSLDIVEIDPGFVDIAKKYFDLTENPRLSIVTADARVFLNQPARKYDAIYVDVFGSATFIPFHMTTQEAARRIHDTLGPDGIVLMNILSPVEGQRAEFLRAEVATYRSVFPHVELLQVFSRPADQLQNVILAAFKGAAEPEWTSKDPEMQQYLAHRVTRPLETEAAVLTDDFAPVEMYMIGADPRSLWGRIKGR